MPSSQPVRKTTGNSRPLAVCRVIRVTTPSAESGTASASATSDSCSMTAISRSPASGGTSSSTASASAVRIGVAVAVVGAPGRRPRPRSTREPLWRPGFSVVSRSTLTSWSRFSSRDPSCGSSDALQLRAVAGAVQHGGEQVGRLHPEADLGPQPGQQFAERGQRVRRPRGQARDLRDPLQRLTEPDAFPFGEHRHRGLGAIADAAARGVQDAAQVDLVVGVGDGPQVRQRVLDLLALVEPHAADDPVRHAGADEHVLQRPGRGVGPVEDSDVTEDRVAGVDQRVDLLADELRLVVLVVADVPDDLGAAALRGPQVLRPPLRVAGDDGVRRGQDGLGGAVVLLQHDRAGLRIVPLELDDVADGRAAEGVDRLVGVTRPPPARRAAPARRPPAPARRRRCAPRGRHASRRPAP